MNKLTVTLPSDREIHLERTFDAPREKVWKACIDPELIPKWWGAREATTVVDKMDVKEGGVWRYVQRMKDGTEYAFNGVYKEINPIDLLSYTFEFELMPGHILLETVRLEEHEGKTKMIITDLFDSKEDRDGMLQSNMEAGANESYDRLDELLLEL